MAKQEQIYTIPVNDAFNQEAICPLCELDRVRTEALIEYYLGPSLMEADHRVHTNAKGFCSQHLTSLYNSQKNRLGLALMLHTHLQELSQDLEQTLAQAQPSDEGGGLFSRNRGNWKEGLAKAADRLQSRSDACVICDRLNETMDRYIDVVFWQYTQDEDFRRKFREGQGFCLAHTGQLLNGAAVHLKQKEAAAFVRDLAKLQNAHFKELTDDVEWFTLKFDYRNQNEPWRNSKDAVPRAIRRLEGLSDLK